MADHAAPIATLTGMGVAVANLVGDVTSAVILGVKDVFNAIYGFFKSIFSSPWTIVIFVVLLLFAFVWAPFYPKILQGVQIVYTDDIRPVLRDVVVPVVDALADAYVYVASWWNFLYGFLHYLLFDIVTLPLRCNYFWDFIRTFMKQIVPFAKGVALLFRLLLRAVLGNKPTIQEPQIAIGLMFNATATTLDSLSSAVGCWCSFFTYYIDLATIHFENVNTQCVLSNIVGGILDIVSQVAKLLFAIVDYLEELVQWFLCWAFGFVAGSCDKKFPYPDLHKIIPDLDSVGDRLETIICCGGDLIDDVGTTLIDTAIDMLNKTQILPGLGDPTKLISLPDFHDLDSNHSVWLLSSPFKAVAPVIVEGARLLLHAGANVIAPNYTTNPVDATQFKQSLGHFCIAITDGAASLGPHLGHVAMAGEIAAVELYAAAQTVGVGAIAGAPAVVVPVAGFIYGPGFINHTCLASMALVEGVIDIAIHVRSYDDYKRGKHLDCFLGQVREMSVAVEDGVNELFDLVPLWRNCTIQDTQFGSDGMPLAFGFPKIVCPASMYHDEIGKSMAFPWRLASASLDYLTTATEHMDSWDDFRNQSADCIFDEMARGLRATALSSAELFNQLPDSAYDVSLGTNTSAKLARELYKWIWPWLRPLFKTGGLEKRVAEEEPVFARTDACSEAVNMQFRYNAGDYSPLQYSPYDGSLLPASDGNLRWMFAGGGSQASPVFSDGIIYVGGYASGLFAIDAKTGTERWNFATTSAILDSPAVSDGVVYFGGTHVYPANYLYAADASTGTELWRYDTGADVIASPVVAYGTVFIGTSDNRLLALSAGAGDLMWTYTATSQIESAVYVAGGLVYLEQVAGPIVAVDAATGLTAWSSSASIGAITTPVVVEGMVYFVTSNGNVDALDAVTGDLFWLYQTGVAIGTSSPAVGAGAVFVACQDGTVRALNTANGTLIWEFTAGGPVVSSPSYADGIVYVGGTDGILYAFDAYTGVPVWTYDTMSVIGPSSPIIVHGVVYFGAYDGNLYAIGNQSSPAVTSLTGSVSKTTVTGGWIHLPLSIKGILETEVRGCRLAGVVLSLQTNATGSWTDVPGETVTTKSDGSYKLKISDRISGTFSYRTYFAGNATFAPAASDPEDVAVTPAPENLEELVAWLTDYVPFKHEIIHDPRLGDRHFGVLDALRQYPFLQAEMAVSLSEVARFVANSIRTGDLKNWKFPAYNYQRLLRQEIRLADELANTVSVYFCELNGFIANASKYTEVPVCDWFINVTAINFTMCPLSLIPCPAETIRHVGAAAARLVDLIPQLVFYPEDAANDLLSPALCELETASYELEREFATWNLQLQIPVWGTDLDFHAPLILGGAAYGVTKILEVVNKLLAEGIKAFFHHGGVSMPQCANATLETPSYDPISARCVACYDIANASERCPNGTFCCPKSGKCSKTCFDWDGVSASIDVAAAAYMNLVGAVSTPLEFVDPQASKLVNVAGQVPARMIRGLLRFLLVPVQVPKGTYRDAMSDITCAIDPLGEAIGRAVGTGIALTGRVVNLIVHIKGGNANSLAGINDNMARLEDASANMFAKLGTLAAEVVDVPFTVVGTLLDTKQFTSASAWFDQALEGLCRLQNATIEVPYAVQVFVKEIDVTGNNLTCELSRLVGSGLNVTQEAAVQIISLIGTATGSQYLGRGLNLGGLIEKMRAFVVELGNTLSFGFYFVFKIFIPDPATRVILKGFFDGVGVLVAAVLNLLLSVVECVVNFSVQILNVIGVRAVICGTSTDTFEIVGPFLRALAELLTATGYVFDFFSPGFAKIFTYMAQLLLIVLDPLSALHRLVTASIDLLLDFFALFVSFFSGNGDEISAAAKTFGDSVLAFINAIWQVIIWLIDDVIFHGKHVVECITHFAKCIRETVDGKHPLDNWSRRGTDAANTTVTPLSSILATSAYVFPATGSCFYFMKNAAASFYVYEQDPLAPVKSGDGGPSISLYKRVRIWHCSSQISDINAQDITNASSGRRRSQFRSVPVDEDEYEGGCDEDPTVCNINAAAHAAKAVHTFVREFGEEVSAQRRRPDAAGVATERTLAEKRNEFMRDFLDLLVDRVASAGAFVMNQTFAGDGERALNTLEFAKNFAREPEEKLLARSTDAGRRRGRGGQRTAAASRFALPPQNFTKDECGHMGAAMFDQLYPEYPCPTNCPNCNATNNHFTLQAICPYLSCFVEFEEHGDASWQLDGFGICARTCKTSYQSYTFETACQPLLFTKNMYLTGNPWTVIPQWALTTPYGLAWFPYNLSYLLAVAPQYAGMTDDEYKLIMDEDYTYNPSRVSFGHPTPCANPVQVNTSANATEPAITGTFCASDGPLQPSDSCTSVGRYGYPAFTYCLAKCSMTIPRSLSYKIYTQSFPMSAGGLAFLQQACSDWCANYDANCLEPVLNMECNTDLLSATVCETVCDVAWTGDYDYASLDTCSPMQMQCGPLTQSDIDAGVHHSCVCPPAYLGGANPASDDCFCTYETPPYAGGAFDDGSRVDFACPVTFRDPVNHWLTKLDYGNVSQSLDPWKDARYTFSGSITFEDVDALGAWGYNQTELPYANTTLLDLPSDNEITYVINGTYCTNGTETVSHRKCDYEDIACAPMYNCTVTLECEDISIDPQTVAAVSETPIIEPEVLPISWTYPMEFTLEMGNESCVDTGSVGWCHSDYCDANATYVSPSPIGTCDPARHCARGVWCPRDTSCSAWANATMNNLYAAYFAFPHHRVDHAAPIANLTVHVCRNVTRCTGPPGACSPAYECGPWVTAQRRVASCEALPETADGYPKRIPFDPAIFGHLPGISTPPFVFDATSESTCYDPYVSQGDLCSFMCMDPTTGGETNCTALFDAGVDCDYYRSIPAGSSYCQPAALRWFCEQLGNYSVITSSMFPIVGRGIYTYPDEITTFAPWINARACPGGSQYACVMVGPGLAVETSVNFLKRLTDAQCSDINSFLQHSPMASYHSIITNDIISTCLSAPSSAHYYAAVIRGDETPVDPRWATIPYFWDWKYDVSPQIERVYASSYIRDFTTGNWKYIYGNDYNLLYGSRDVQQEEPTEEDWLALISAGYRGDEMRVADDAKDVIERYTDVSATECNSTGTTICRSRNCTLGLLTPAPCYAYPIPEGIDENCTQRPLPDCAANMSSDPCTSTCVPYMQAPADAEAAYDALEEDPPPARSTGGPSKFEQLSRMLADAAEAKSGREEPSDAFDFTGYLIRTVEAAACAAHPGGSACKRLARLIESESGLQPDTVIVGARVPAKTYYGAAKAAREAAAWLPPVGSVDRSCYMLCPYDYLQRARDACLDDVSQGTNLTLTHLLETIQDDLTNACTLAGISNASSYIVPWDQVLPQLSRLHLGGTNISISSIITPLEQSFGGNSTIIVEIKKLIALIANKAGLNVSASLGIDEIVAAAAAKEFGHNNTEDFVRAAIDWVTNTNLKEDDGSVGPLFYIELASPFGNKCKGLRGGYKIFGIPLYSLFWFPQLPLWAGNATKNVFHAVADQRWVVPGVMIVDEGNCTDNQTLEIPLTDSAPCSPVFRKCPAPYEFSSILDDVYFLADWIFGNSSLISGVATATGSYYAKYEGVWHWPDFWTYFYCFIVSGLSSHSYMLTFIPALLGLLVAAVLIVWAFIKFFATCIWLIFLLLIFMPTRFEYFGGGGGGQ